jgi:hypothetical protein
MPGELYWRELETGALPGDGDHVVLYPPDDPSDSDHGGPYVFVRRRYLGPYGTWHIELQQIVIDPPEKIRMQLGVPLYRDYAIWWVSQTSDPDPRPGLLEAGWIRYGSEDV